MAKEFITAGTRKNAWTIDPALLTVIGIDTEDGPDHELYDARILDPLDEAMVANIATLGVLEPVLVDKDEADRVLVVDGRRRVLHAREANRRLAAQGEPTIEVPVYADSVRRGGRAADKTRWGLVMVSANEIRREDTVLNRATKAKAMVDRGVSKGKVATVFGVSEVQVDRWLVLATAPEAIRSKVASGELSATTAVSIAMKAPAQHKRALEVAEKLAKKAGKAPSKRELDKATGKATPPSRKELKAVLARLEGTPAAEVGTSAGFVAGLRWALSGGPLPEYVAGKPAPPKAQSVAEDLASIARAATEDVVIEFGLTDRATKVWSDDPRDETICTRLDRAGHALAPEDVSKACASLHRQGRIEKRPHGYRMRAGSVA